jgi:hypothetical protein
MINPTDFHKQNAGPQSPSTALGKMGSKAQFVWLILRATTSIETAPLVKKSIGPESYRIIHMILNLNTEKTYFEMCTYIYVTGEDRGPTELYRTQVL